LSVREEQTFEAYQALVLESCIIAGHRRQATAQTLRAFAAAWTFHENDAPRKTGEPFISHPVAVQRILADYGVNDPATHRAALLHDAIEDTDATLEDIKDFGPRTVNRVDELTMPDCPPETDSTRWRDEYLEGLERQAGDFVIIVKAADRLHNLQTSHVLPVAKRRRMAEEAKRRLVRRTKQINMLLGEALEAEADIVLAQCEEPQKAKATTR